MIKYALLCQDCEHEFDSWFASSDAFDALVSQNAVDCPVCASTSVAKAIMAPAVKAKEPRAALDIEAFAKKARAHIAENFDHVGSGFADEARAMYYGDKDHRPIWGQTTAEERAALEDEGVPAAPLPAALAPVVPKDPDELN